MLSPATRRNCFLESQDLLQLLGMTVTSRRSTGVARVEQGGVPHFFSLVRGSKSHLLRDEDGNYLDRLGKTEATAGWLPICQLLANWSDALRNPKSPLRDLLISGRVYTWFLRFLELIDFSLEYFLPSLSALNCVWPKVHSGVIGLTKSVSLVSLISFPHHCVVFLFPEGPWLCLS